MNNITNNPPTNQQVIEGFSQPTNASRQNSSPIALETPALNNQEHSTATRHASDFNSAKVAHEIYSTIRPEIDDNDLKKLNTCLENLRSATQEEIFSVLSQRFGAGYNLLLSMIYLERLEMVQLLLPFYHLVSKENLQTLLLQNDNDFKANCLIWAQSETFKLILPFCYQLSPENLQTLLLQQDCHGSNLLMSVMLPGASDKLKRLELLLPLLNKLSPENLETMLVYCGDVGEDCLLSAINSQNLGLLKLVLYFYWQLPTETLEYLFWQQNHMGRNCLISAINCANPEILQLIVDLYTRVSPQVLERDMKPLKEEDKLLVAFIILNIKEQKTGAFYYKSNNPKIHKKLP